MKEFIFSFNYSGYISTGVEKIDEKTLTLNDLFTINKKRVIDFCKEMTKRKINLKWKCMGRIDQIDEEMIDKMQKSGCIQISFGIESLNQKSLDRINKEINIHKIKKAIKACHDVGILVTLYFILGFPWETKKDFKGFLNSLKELDECNLVFGMLVPYPGTEFYENQEKYGFNISNHEWEKYTQFIPLYNTVNFSEKD